MVNLRGEPVCDRLGDRQAYARHVGRGVDRDETAHRDVVGSARKRLNRAGDPAREEPCNRRGHGQAYGRTDGHGEPE